MAKSDITRRGFVGASAAALGMGAVASMGTVGVGAAVAAEAAPAGINPQDEEAAAACTTDFSPLFQPIKIGKLELRNRFVKSAAGSDTYDGNPDGLNDNYMDYYEGFARDGAAFVWLESLGNMYSINVRGDQRSVTGLLANGNGAEILKPVVDRIHAQGAYVGMQYFSMALSASTLAAEDIPWIQEQLVNFAVILKDAGCDGFEMNASAAHFGNSWLSRNINTRTDEYGAQSAENRTRFHVELVRKIKEACGEDFVVEYLINGVEENDAKIGANSLMETIEEACENAAILEAAGVNAFYIRSSVPSMHIAQFAPDLQFAGYRVAGNTGLGSTLDYAQHYEGMANGAWSGAAFNMKMVTEIKKHVSVPVGCSGYMDPRATPDIINNAVANGECDLLFMTRPLTVDPEYITKLSQGRRDEIAPCTHCMHCHFKGGRELCRVNAVTQRAYSAEMPEGYKLLPAETVKKVAVIGAGPAGLEAARIAAKRGHNVTLFEKSNILGGMLNIAHAYKGEHERLGDLVDYLVKQQEICGVDVVTGVEATAATIADGGFDAAVVAVGGQRVSKLEAAGAIPVCVPENLPAFDLGDSVVICGVGAQAIDIALYLVAQGKKVQLVNEGPESAIGNGHSDWYKQYLIPYLYSKGTRIWNNAQIVGVAEDGLAVILNSGLAKTLVCTGIVECYEMAPNTALAEALEGVCETYAVGDCADPLNIAMAIGNANLAARKI